MSLPYNLHIIIIISLILLFNPRILCNSQWFSPSSSKLPRADNSMVAGSYNYSIYLLGGGFNGYQLVEYDIFHDIFNDHGSSIFPNDIYGESSYYTQIDNILYIIDRGGDTLLTYNMKTDEFNSNYQSIPTTVDKYGCLASNTDYLFVVGGYSHKQAANLDIVQVLDLSNNIWFDNAPSMQEQRLGLSCVVDPLTNILYAIGGYRYTGNQNLPTYTDTIESIDTNNIIDNIWSYITGSLSYSLAWTESVLYGRTIYVIGGVNGPWDTQIDFDTVHEIDLMAGTVSLSPHRLLYVVSQPSVIIVDNILYVFGGWGVNERIDSWMLYEFNIKDPTNDSINMVTTVLPTTISPTHNPTETSWITSLTTSNAQITAPSAYPSFDPISLSPSSMYSTDIAPEPTDPPTAFQADYINNVTSTIDQLITDEMRTTIELLNEQSGSNSELYVVLGCLCAILCIAMFCVFMIHKKQTQKAMFREAVSVIRKQPSVSVEDEGMKRINDIECDVGMMRTVEGIPDDRNDDANIETVTVTGAEEVKTTKMIFKKETKRDMVQYWLETVVKLPLYYTVFIENGYETMEIVREIADSAELRDIGINNVNHQSRIMKEILLLRNTNTPL